MINFFFKKVVWNTAIFRARIATMNSGYMCGVQRVKLVSLPVGGRAGGSWGTVGVPGSSWLQPGSSWIKHHAQELAPGGGGFEGGL